MDRIDIEMELAEELAALHDEGEHTAECPQCLTDMEDILVEEFSNYDEDDDEED